MDTNTINIRARKIRHEAKNLNIHIGNGDRVSACVALDYIRMHVRVLEEELGLEEFMKSVANGTVKLGKA